MHQFMNSGDMKTRAQSRQIKVSRIQINRRENALTPESSNPNRNTDIPGIVGNAGI
jgi:hypothetical protein